MKIEINVNLSAASARRLAVVGSTLVILGVAAVAYAVPVTFSANKTLKAAELNSNFSNLEGRVKALESGPRVVTAYIDGTGNGNPVLVRQDEMWVDSLSRTQTGDYVVSLVAGTFSAVPTCVASGESYVLSLRDTGSWTKSTVKFMTYNDAGPLTNARFMISCSGPR